MNFLEVPLTMGIVSYFVYMTFELIVRKKERLTLIEKLGMNIAPTDPNIFKAQFSSLLPSLKSKSFTGLKIGCLLLGLGVGLMAGLMIHFFIIAEIKDTNNWQVQEMSGVGYGAAVLFFGGTGLIISFLIENNLSKKEESKVK
jgi:hypothetical protein